MLHVTCYIIYPFFVRVYILYKFYLSVIYHAGVSRSIWIEMKFTYKLLMKIANIKCSFKVKQLWVYIHQDVLTQV